MKTVFIVLIVLILVVLGLVGYLTIVLPAVDDAPELTVERSPTRIQRGEYLANSVAVCMDCHSSRDWTLFSGPILLGTLGKGGEYFGPEMGFPGSFFSKNITPAGLKDWTDGEIFRAITTGVDRKGKVLFPVMPYLNYGKMDKEDIYDIIAYIRSIPAIENETMKSKASFPMNFLMNTIPKNPSFTKRSSPADSVKYGAYLINAAACIECHTPMEKGKVIVNLAYSGGREFAMPSGIVRSANITPDMETGIGGWTEKNFVDRFKFYEDPAHVAKIGKNQMNSIMPWTMYARMDSSDLKAIYHYLHSLKPIQNEVLHFADHIVQR